MLHLHIDIGENHILELFKQQGQQLEMLAGSRLL